MLALLNKGTSAAKTATKAVKGQLAPDWQLSGFDGKPIKLSDFKGKVVLLNFWATWCAPCRKEIPTLVALQKEHGERGVAVIGVSLDQGDPAAVQSFASRMGITYPVAIGNENVQTSYGVEAIPTTFIVDRAGNIVAVHQGDAPRELIEADITAAL